MTVSIWEKLPNFKIRSKADVERFLTESLCPNNTYMVKIREDYAIVIETHKDKETEVFAKFGDLRDIFNPLIKLDKQEVMHTLWFYRKKINEHFYS